MGRFNKSGKRGMPELNTSSLPDLIFTMLFFFMMITSMREVTLKVQFKAPQATELEKLEKKSLGKSEKIKKYEFLGLVLFVGIPLPGTGAWTGSLIASLLNIKIKKAFPAICLGLLLATVIMCIITYAIPWLITNVF